MNEDIKEIISNNQDAIAPVVSKYLQDKSVLDVGCGNGLNSVLISERYNAQMTLLDINDIRSEESLIFPFVKSSIDKIPFEDKKFDMAFVQYVLHHISLDKSLADTFKELSRIAKAIVLIEEISTDKTNLKDALDFDEKVNNMIHPGVIMPVYKYYSDEQLKEIFNKASLELLEENIINKGSEETGYIQNKIYILSAKC